MASASKPKGPRKRRRWPYVLGALLVLALALAGTVAARGPFFFMSCDPDALGPSRLDRTSYVYSADGEVLGTLGAGYDQRPVRLQRISPMFRKATIAIEDRRFYEHEGIDYIALVRALFRDVAAGGVVEGGSTITQQLARNLYLGRDQSFHRKLEEGCLAVALEREWSKDKILETYLNTAYYGNGAYGAQAAARTYFSKSAQRLNLEEAALLAGLPQAPSQYDPFSNEDGARSRREEVLSALSDTGDISERRAAAAAAAPLALDPGQAGRRQDRSVVNLVLDELTERYGAAVIRHGGLEVHTTIQAKLQRAARAAVRSQLDRRKDPAAAVVAIDPSNGAIRALTSVAPGGVQFFDLAAQGRRQVGSAFKPFVLTAAIEKRINPWATKYLSAPFEGPPANGKPWLVKTYDGTYLGRIPITDATLRSDNTVYARLTLDVGPDNVVDVAKAMGITSAIKPVPSVGLGSASISPLELASAYATFASGGLYAKPYLIREVKFPDGRDDNDERTPEERKRVLDEPVTYEVTRILEGNIESGTGTEAQIGRPAAGKTGTTDDYSDAWFAGYTPQLAAAVWVGYPRGRVPMTDVHGIEVAGGTFPAAIWGKFMQQALDGVAGADWARPGGTVDWKRWCGRYQFAPTYRQARPEAGCPKPKPKPPTPKPVPMPTTGKQTTTAAPPPPPPPSRQPAPQPPPSPKPPPPPPPPAGNQLVGAEGKVTVAIDNSTQTGEVEIRGQLYPAQSESGEPLPEGTPVVVVRRDAEFLYVAPR
jgi:penicillin-binding protein 1A